MLVYQANKVTFLSDVRDRNIEDIVRNEVRRRLNIRVAEPEVRSWKNSLAEMSFVLDDDRIPSDAGIAIEYRIPQTAKRIDFIITGEDERHREHAVLVELKQWEKASKTHKDGIVSTRFHAGVSETPHPSFQVWSYAQLLRDFDAAVYEEGIGLQPCAYLHNYTDDGVLSDPFYEPYISDAPVYFRGDKEKLRNFISKYVRFGEKKQTLYRIDHGKIRPSKGLAESLSGMLKGNREFVMIDDQKLVFETAVDIGRRATPANKQVLIVKGGPGTGKSVVAINLLSHFTTAGRVVHYATKNAAPRDVFQSMLTGDFTKRSISNLFKGTGSYTDASPNDIGVLIVDEAHRMTEKSGMYRNLGENQIKEAISAAEFSVFFVDEDQAVTWADIGDVGSIRVWAERMDAHVTEMELASQFRCNGSDGYLAWLDSVLGIRETANTVFDERDFNIKVFDTATEMREAIEQENEGRNRSRVVAGYCWDWKSKKDAAAMDIVIPEERFSMRWNLQEDGNLFILKKGSISEAGCIHTCQGLELDYVGVIIGDDLIVRDGVIITDPKKRAKTDKSLSGYGIALKKHPERAREKADRLIKNTYRTLMTRGMKGCYVYCTDKETREYFKKMLGQG